MNKEIDILWRGEKRREEKSSWTRYIIIIKQDIN